MSASNGTTTKVTWWVMGVISVLIGIGFAAWLNTLQASIVSISTDVKHHVGEIASLQSSFGSIEGRLVRIEYKVDRVIEKENKHVN